MPNDTLKTIGSNYGYMRGTCPSQSVFTLREQLADVDHKIKPCQLLGISLGRVFIREYQARTVRDGPVCLQ